MAIQWMDNFNIYGIDAGRVGRLLNGLYASASWVDLVPDPDPTAVGYVLQSTNTNFSNIRKVMPAAATTVGVALRHYLSGLPSAGKEANIIWAQDVNANWHIVIVVDPSGNLKVYRNDAAGSVLLGATATPALIANAWQHIEAKVFLDVAVGTVEIRVEGTTVLLIPATRTTSNVGGVVASAQNISLLGGNGNYGANTYIKDFIIWDGSGARNNNFLGSCVVYKIIPNGDVLLNWTLSAGATGFNLINETTPDDDVSYISAPYPLPAGPYKCSLTDLPLTVTSVKGVMPIHRSRKTDGGDGNVRTGVISGASTGLGTDRPITTAYTFWYDIFETDPSTAGPWTRLGVNNMNLQLDRTV